MDLPVEILKFHVLWLAWSVHAPTTHSHTSIPVNLGWFGTLHWFNRWTCLVIPSFAVVVRWYTFGQRHHHWLISQCCRPTHALSRWYSVSFTYTNQLGALVGSPGNYSVPLPTNCLVCPASPYHLRHFIGVARHTPGQFPHIPNGYVDTPAPRVPLPCSYGCFCMIFGFTGHPPGKFPHPPLCSVDPTAPHRVIRPFYRLVTMLFHSIVWFYGPWLG